ncbi:MAG: Sugar transporter permease [Chloroflexi bacterium]|jgi:putative aldouronate transport system permease protein|nr:Sugar transporter permease [Chloroflexota bacterium]
MQRSIKPAAALPTAGSRRPAALPRRLARGLKRRAAKNGTLLLMALPALLVLLMLNYLPMVGIVIAFKDYKAYQGIWGSAWVGLQNFHYLFSQDAWTITRNTLLMNSLFIVTTLVGALGVAVLLNEIRDTSKWGTKFYQSAIFFPFFMSWVIVATFAFAFLSADSGLLNNLLTSVGLPAQDWYASVNFWPAILVVVNLWKVVGFNSLIYLAGMVAINPEYYEAARVDGASKWAQIRTITIPLIAPLITVNVLLQIGRIFYADFGLFYQVPNNSPILYPATDVVDTYVFRSLIQIGDVGMAAAAGLYQAIVGFALVILANWFVRRIDPDRALF